MQSAIKASSTRPYRPSPRYVGVRGIYGEIIPPPFIQDVSMEKALKLVTECNRAQNQRVDRPTKGQSLDGLQNIAQMTLQWFRLLEIFAVNEATIPRELKLLHQIVGKFSRTRAADDLYRAVVEDGDRLSLLPLGLHFLIYPTFAPILQRDNSILSDEAGLTWRVGVGGKSFVETFTAQPYSALLRSGHIYAERAENDNQVFREYAKTIAKPPHTLLYDYAYWKMTCDGGRGIWDHSDDFRLGIVGAHELMRYESPFETRLLQYDPQSLIRVVDVTARNWGLQPDYPSLEQARAWLQDSGAPLPQIAQWSTSDIGLPVVFDGIQPNPKTGKTNRYELVYQRGFIRVLMMVEDVGSGSNKRLVAETVCEKPIAEWMRSSEGRQLVVGWALWAAGERVLSDDRQR